MPNFETGGIDVAVEPSFKGFRRKLRDGLLEEERRAPEIDVQVDPKLKKGFKRELVELVRKASAGVDIEVEAHPGLRKGFRKELSTLVQEAALGIGVEVEAKPGVAKGFRTELTKLARAASAGIDMEIEANPNLAAGFRTKLRDLAQLAAKGVTVSVAAFPNLATGFHTMLQRRVDTATTGVSSDIEMEPELATGFHEKVKAEIARSVATIRPKIDFQPGLATGFRVKLRELVAASTKTLRYKIEFHPSLIKGFRTTTAALVKKEMARYHADLTLRPSLGKGFKTQMKTLAKSAAFEATVKVETQAISTIRKTIRDAVHEATRVPPLVAVVEIHPDIRDLRRRTNAAMRSVNRTAKLSPQVDGNTLRRRTISDVSQAMAAANRIAKINIVTHLRNTASKGLSTLTASLHGVTRAARLAGIGLAAVAVGIGAAGAAGIKSAADFEFTRTNFGILLDDVAKGEEVFQSLVKAARTSIYELPDLQPLVQNLLVTSKLLPKTLPFSDVTKVLTEVTDLGAALDITAPAMTRLGLAFAKIAGRGALKGEELRSLSKAAPGLNTISLIAKDLGVTIPEAFKAISEGAVSSDDAIRIVLQGIRDFKGAAGAGLKEVTTTFKGAMSNLADILRFEFFDAFDEQLPKLTAVIGPDGPLIAAFHRAAPAIAKAFVPLANTLFESLAAFAPALQSAFEVVVPIFVQLGRASERVALQVRRMFDEIGPSLGNLGTAFAALMVGLAPVLPILGKIVALVANQLTRVLEGLISSGAIDLILDLFDGLHGALEKLLPILASVVQMIGEALLEAISNIDLEQLGESLGLLAEAGGDLLVALAPLIPELVEIVAIFAEALAPAIEASIPLLVGFTDVLVPIARVLADLGPGILILYGIVKAAAALGTGVALIAKFAGGLANLHHTLTRVNEGETQNLSQKLGLTDDAGKFTQRLTTGLKTVAAAGAVTAAALTSYFAAASSDITMQIAGMATSIGSIAVAFAVSWQAGVIAAAMAGVAAILGHIAKKSREAAEELKRIDTLAAGFQESFKITGVDTLGQRIIGITHRFSELLDATQDLEGHEGATEFFGRFKGNVTIASIALAKGEKAFKSYAKGVVDARISEILAGDAQTIKDFSDVAGDAVDDMVGRLGTLQGLDITHGHASITAVEDLGKAFLRGGIDADTLVGKLVKLGATVPNATKAVKELKDGVTSGLRELAGADFAKELSPAMQQAINDQKILDEVTNLLKTDTEKITGAFQGFEGAIDDTAQALRDFRQAEQGDQKSTDEVLLGSIAAGKEIIEIQKQLIEAETTRVQVQKDLAAGNITWAEAQERLAAASLTNSEAEAQIRAAIRASADENSTAIARLMIENSTSFGDFKKKADALRATTMKGLYDSFIAMGMSEDEAKTKAQDLTDKILEIPGSTTFEAFVKTHQDEIEDFIKALKRLNEIKLKEINIRVRTHVEELGQGSGRSFESMGKLVRKPQLSVVGEDGPELILPLTKPARMAKLIKETMDAGLLGGPAAAALGPTTPANVRTAAPTALPPGVGAPATGLGLNFTPTVDPEVGADFTQMAAESVADLGQKLVENTDPGLERWRGKVSNHLDQVVTRMTTFGTDSKASMTKTVTDLTTIATFGSASVVGALDTGLTRGTTTVKRIVGGYAKSLAHALNPVLDAIGEPQIDLSKFRKGGIKNPRIVADGAYDVHVFGERGTKGEAYIPFDPALKPRSRAIAEETVKRLGGRAEWFRGGGITGDVVGLDPEFIRRLERWSVNLGTTYNVGSGYRSFEEQRHLYQRYLAGVPGQAQAAPPGKSMHNFGLASDGPHWRGRGPSNFGLRFPMSYEPWHVEPNEAREWAGMGDRHASIVPLPKVPLVGPHGQLGITGKKAMQFTYEQALAWAGSQAVLDGAGALTYSGGGGASEAAARAWIGKAMLLAGVSGPSWMAGMLTLTRRESNFDPRAINLWDSNARRGTPSKGIAQMIMSTFLAHALPGYTDIWNPVHNLISAIRYIESKGGIGTIQQANPNMAPRGYGDGAIVYKEEIARISERNKPEVIIPLTKPERALALADKSGVTAMVRDRDDKYFGPKNVFEKGAIQVDVTPPAAETAEAYAASMGNRLLPAIAAAVNRAQP